MVKDNYTEKHTRFNLNLASFNEQSSFVNLFVFTHSVIHVNQSITDSGVTFFLAVTQQFRFAQQSCKNIYTSIVVSTSFTIQFLSLTKIALESFTNYYFIIIVIFLCVKKVFINNSALQSEKSDVTYWLLISIY